LKKYGKKKKKVRETRLRMRALKGSTLPTFCTTTKKKARDALHVANFRSKGLTRADIVQLPVAHVHSVLPNRAPSSNDVTSDHVISVDPPHGSTTNTNWKPLIILLVRVCTSHNAVYPVISEGWHFTTMLLTQL
jgi:hypothetical protein